MPKRKNFNRRALSCTSARTHFGGRRSVVLRNLPFQTCQREPRAGVSGVLWRLPIDTDIVPHILNCFKRGFLLNRDFGLRETSLKQNYMGFRQSVAGIKGAGRDARVVVPTRSVDRAFYIFYTLLLCVTGPTPGTIPPYYCVQQ